MNAPQLSTETRASRMAPLARLPVFVALDGKRALVAGNGPGVAWKVELLSAAGAVVDVYAGPPGAELRAVAADPPAGSIVLHERPWRPGDFPGAAIAVGGFDSESQAARFAAAARAAGVPVNMIDKPAYCDFTFGAIVNRSPLVIGISTDGAAPVFAQAIRARLEAMIPRGFTRWAEAASRWRRLVKVSGLVCSARHRFWQAFTTLALNHADHVPRPCDFERLLDQVRRKNDAPTDEGSVTVLAVGHGNPELLTLRALRALQSADVIVIDGLVAPDILEFARREAKVMGGNDARLLRRRHDEIEALTARLVKAGQRVVRLTSDAPTVRPVDSIGPPS